MRGGTIAVTFAPVWTDRRWIGAAALLWLGCSALYFLTAPGRIDIIDGGIRYDVTQSLIDVHRPIVRDEWLPAALGRNGFRYTYYQLGSSLTAIPFVLLGSALSHGSLESKQFAFSLTTVPFAAAIVAFVFLIYGRLGCAMPRAAVWAFVLAFCSLLWPYAGSTFDAVLQAFWLTLAVWATVEALAAWSYRWATLSAAAFVMLVNTQEAYVVLGGCIAAVSPPALRPLLKRLSLGIVQAVAAGLLVGMLLVLWYNHARFGDLGNHLSTGQVTGAHPLMGSPVVGLVGLFLSPANSIFLYSPTFLLGLIGLRRLMRNDSQRVAPIVWCLAIHVLLISSLRFWSGGWNWGPRYLVASLPLVSIGMPFAWPNSERRVLKGSLCALGCVVQILGISVDHQRYYFERSFPPFFWLDERTMYRDSPLLARPGELIALLQQRDVQGARALVPGPRPFSMTSYVFGPPAALLPESPRWMREYLVFLVPRPWTLWSRFLPQEQRPGRTGLMTAIGCLVAGASFGALIQNLKRGS